MRGPAAGEGASASVEGRLRLRDIAVPLVLIVALGLALRLIIAYGLMPGSGFKVDRYSFSGWATDLAANGLSGFYQRSNFADYTPGYLYVLWLLGLASNVLNGPDAGVGDLMKLPPILADGLMAVVVALMAVELGAGRRGALLAAGLFMFNPVTWFDSAIWAQVDSVGTLVLLLAVRELGRGRSETTAILATIAAITKPQFGILIPIAAAVILKRHLLDRREPLRVLSTAGAGLATAVVVCAPFGLSIIDLLVQIVRTAGGYPYITVNAYNPWALAEFEGGGLAAHGTWICDGPDPKCQAFLSIAGVPAVAWGTALLLAAMLGLAVFAAWRDRQSDARARYRDLVAIMAIAAVAFFILPTRVHERYLFPFFAFGAVMAGVSRRWLAPYAILASANLANLYGILTWPFYENLGLDPILSALGGLGARLGEAARSFAGIALAAIAHTAGLLLAVASVLWPEPPAEADEAAGSHAGDWVGAGGLAPARGTDLRSTGVATLLGRPPPPKGPEPPQPSRPPTASGPASPALSGLAATDRWVMDHLTPRTQDRTATLAHEGGGRLDRLDVLLLLAVVVVSLTLRVFRLDEPARMHFDEVYHARTAAEFLQYWRYGLQHHIYEYTHPHLAKYAIAGGLVVLGDNQVVSRSQLEGGVRDAAIELRWDDPSLGPDGGPIRAGERLYLAGDGTLAVHDLRTRARLASFAVPGAAAVAVDEVSHHAYVGTDDGAVLVLDTAAAADAVRAAATPSGEAGANEPSAAGPVPLLELGVAVERLWTVDDGQYLLAATASDGLVAIDPYTGRELARITLPGRSEIVDAGNAEALVATPAEVINTSAVANQLAALLGGEADAYRERLATEADTVTVAAVPDDQREAVDGAIADGRLTGLSFKSVPRVAVAARDGVVFLEPSTLATMDTIPLDAPATGLTRAQGIEDDLLLYAPSGTSVVRIRLPADRAPSDDQTIPMPGPVTRAVFDPATELLHVLGSTPDGTGTTVYVIEPRGASVFADARLPFSPTAWALDADLNYPAADREQLLVFASDGATAAVDTGGNAFAWRLPGVVAGALTAGLLFLLARILFRRRTIAVLAGVFAVLDGMFFVQSRIAMNDAYVGLFVMAAVVVFAAVWTGAWPSRRAFWLAMPAVGLLLGLALASKWVALYAIGGLGILVLARSALGRVLLVVGLAAITGILGYQAVAPEVKNWTFLVIMIGLTLLAAAVVALRPVAWTAEEVRFAVAAPVVLGGALALVAIPLGLEQLYLLAAIALIVMGGVVYLVFLGAGALGWGPAAPPPEPDDPVRLLDPPAPAPRGWLRLGADGGLPVVWLMGALLVIPLAVYIASYIPWLWVEPGGNQLFTGWPAGNGGQTLWALTQSMYRYHDELRATHAASSPWWAWPLDLKPVWFYQGGSAGATTAAIYSGGNLATWWLALPALAFGAWQAFRRRSAALGFVVIMAAALWLPWARIDRATFEYHYYAALPFVLLAVAYFVAEAWHGPSRWTWLLLRATAAVAILGPAVLWLLLQPLCRIAGVDRANKDSWACTAQPGLGPEVSWQAIVFVAVVVAGVLLLGWLLVRLGRVPGSAASDGERGRAVAHILVAAAGLGAALVLVAVAFPGTPAFSAGGIPRELFALLVAVPLGIVACVVLTARSPRRFTIGLVMVTTLVFVVFYPNWAALPLPDPSFNLYQAILPTWEYAFQFAVNTSEPSATPPGLFGAAPLVIVAALLLAATFVGYSAWAWRLSRAERAADEVEAAEPAGH